MGTTSTSTSTIVAIPDIRMIRYSRGGTFVTTTNMSIGVGTSIGGTRMSCCC